MADIQYSERVDLPSKQHSGDAAKVPGPTGAGSKLKTQHLSACPDSRERLIQAGYELLTQRGASGTGVDLIAGRANCAKATLYNIFGSKAALTLAVLQRREDLWTYDWLEAGINSGTTCPDGRLLAVFDMLHDWFRRDDYEGCTFMQLLFESSAETNVRDAVLAHVANVRAMITNLAEQADLCDVGRFADAWFMIMQGAILTASQGNADAAIVAKRLAEPVLAAWPRQK